MLALGIVSRNLDILADPHSERNRGPAAPPAEAGPAPERTRAESKAGHIQGERTPGPDSAAVERMASAATRSIVLVGLPGAGKSSIGRRLAARLGCPFLDTDAEIEAAAGLPVSEIFARYGEAHFRDGERRVIARILAGPPVVLATGGGAFNDPRTRAAVRASGAVAVWLRCSLPALVRRIARRIRPSR